jgi:hypothetical protein
MITDLPTEAAGEPQKPVGRTLRNRGHLDYHKANGHGSESAKDGASLVNHPGLVT